MLPYDSSFDVECYVLIRTCYPSRQVTLQVMLCTCIVPYLVGKLQHVKELVLYSTCDGFILLTALTITPCGGFLIGST